MQLTSPVRAHADIRRKRVVALLQLSGGAAMCGVGVIGLLDEDASPLRAAAIAVFGLLGVVAGLAGLVVAQTRARQAAALREGGTVVALPVRERQPMDNGGWTFVCDHGGSEQVLTIQGDDGWPVLGGAGGTHLGAVLPASGGPPVAFTESGFPFDLSPDELRAWREAVEAAAGGPAVTVPPSRGKLPYSAKSSAGIGPMTVLGLMLCSLLLLCSGDVVSVLGGASAVLLVWLLVRVLRAVRTVDVRDHEIAWKRRAGSGRIAWSDVGGIAIRAKIRASRGGPSAADIAVGSSAGRAATIALDAISVAEDADEDRPAPERAESQDPVLARLEHLGSRNQRREPDISIHDRTGAIVVRVVGGLPWRLARVLGAEAAARGIPLR